MTDSSELSRREFLRVAGYGCLLGAGACTIPPLHALMDDPPTPSDPHARDSWRIGLCALCPGGCGIRARIIEGRAVGIAGNPLHPISRGALCARGAAGLEVLYDPERVRSPLRRVGDDERPLTWDEAVAAAASAISEARAKGRRIAAVHAGSGEIDAAFIRRFLAAVDSDREADLRAHRSPRARAPFLRTQGIRAPVHYDLAAADYILSFDPGLLEAPWSAVQIQRAFAEFRRGRRDRRGRFLVASARRSVTAMKADEWIPVRPGTEGVLALGIASALAKEDRIDRRAVAELSGWDEFHRALLLKYRLSNVSKATGVSEGAISSIARDLARASAPLVVAPLEEGVLPGETVEAIHLLNALLGRIDVPGGVLVGLTEERVDLVPAVAAPERTGAEAQDDFERIFADGETDVILLHEADPVGDRPDGARWAEAIRKVPLVISFSSRRSETSRLAHLHLPDTTYLEKWNLHAASTTTGAPVWSVGGPIVEVEGGRPLGDSLVSVAAALGGAAAERLPWKDSAEAVRRYAEDLHGNLRQGMIFGPDVEELWTSLLERSGWRIYSRGAFPRFYEKWTETGGFWDPNYPHGERRRVLAHSDHKFHLDPAAMPAGPPDQDDPAGEPGQFPLSLIGHRPAVFSGGASAAPAVRSLAALPAWPVGETFVEIRPEDAARLGLRDDEPVRVFTPGGSARAAVKVVDGVAPGSAAILVGLDPAVVRLFDPGLFARGKGLRARARIERA